MATNQNRNSVRVLRTTSVGYLAHKNISNLSIGTGGDFTIQLWVVKGQNIDGILYGQEGGFTIQLMDGRIIFSMDGFASLSSEPEWALGPHGQDYIALRYHQGVLTLFVGGIPAAEKKVLTTTSACTGDFFIGKQFTGGFSLIRVSSIARSDAEILSGNAVLPGVDNSCVFQSDCSTIQYKDVSGNHLPMWAVGEGAGCGIYTACTVFSGSGQVRCTPLEALPATHTLLLKIWPQDKQERQQVYAAMEGNRTLYALELIPQEGHTFQLALSSDAGEQAVMSKALLPELWQDIAAVFDSGKVSLYLDGQLDGQFPFAFSGRRSDILVGAEYESGKPIYTKGFCGYVSYSAEFGRVLTPEEIALYADDPPFLFEDGLVSILPLDWPNEVESIGATPLSIVGTAAFNMVADITPQNGEIGVSMRLPVEISPEWDTLSPEEKWTFNLLNQLITENMRILYGYPPGKQTDMDPVPVTQGNPSLVKRHHGHLYGQLSRSPSPCPSPAQTKEYGIELSVQGSNKVFSAFGGAQGGAATATAAAGGGAAAATQSHIGIALGTAVGIAVLAGTAVSIASAERERPQRQGALQITGICWDHQGDPSTGSLHYHKGGENLPASMFDVPAGGRLDTLCVLVPSKLTQPKVDVTLHYSGEGTQAKSGTLRAFDLTAGGLLGNQSANYHISPGQTLTVSLPFDKDKLPRGGVYQRTNIWQFRDGETPLINCTCTIYLLPALPVKPWVTAVGSDYSPAEAAYLRTEFIDFFLPEAEQPSDFAQWATRKLNSSGFTYDILGGGDCHYCDFGNNYLLLTKFLDDTRKPDAVLNCADCAHIVSTACAMAGQTLAMVRFFAGGAQGFPCNRIIAIGNEDWRYPFDSTGSATHGGFSYHMFNYNGSDFSSIYTTVYDACLQVDGGEFPGDQGPAGTKKEPHLPTGMPSMETDRPSVSVSEKSPYHGNFYRERLVKNGGVCVFEAGSICYVQGFGRLPAVPVSTGGYINAVMEHFSLAPTEEDRKLLAARPARPWTPRNIRGATPEEAGEFFSQWRLERLGVSCRIKCWQCGSIEETAMRLASEVAAFSHPDKQSGEDLGVRVGERRVVIGGNCIVFSRENHVLVVCAQTLAASKAAAEDLDKDIQQR